MAFGQGGLSRVGSSDAYRYLQRGVAASPALAGRFYHRALPIFDAVRLAPHLCV
jgi:hypothetical protein